MEKMRIARNLRKQLETEYDMNNGYELAEKLANAGYTELNDELRSKVLFLKQICKEVRADNFYVISLLADYWDTWNSEYEKIISAISGR